MNLENIIAVSGMSGLYKVIGQTKNGLVIESLETNKRLPIYAANKVSALEDICIYTATEEKPLATIFTDIHKNLKGKDALDFNSGNDEIKTFFESNIPDYDKDRVYVSDMKKVVRWYNTLNAAGLIKVEEEKKEAAKADKKSATKKETTKKAPAAKKTEAKAKPAAKKTATARTTSKKG